MILGRFTVKITHEKHYRVLRLVPGCWFFGKLPARIHPLYPYRLLNTNDPLHKIDTVSSRYYYIEHFNRHNPEHIKAVEQYAEQQLDSDYHS